MLATQNKHISHNTFCLQPRDNIHLRVVLDIQRLRSFQGLQILFGYLNDSIISCMS